MNNDDENQIIAERRAKLAELRKRGAAFPNDFRREHLAADLHQAWGGKSNGEIEPEAGKAGADRRLTVHDLMGKARFATVEQLRGRIRRHLARQPDHGVVDVAFKPYDLGDRL